MFVILGYLVMLLTLCLHREVNCLQVRPFGRESEENLYKTESNHVSCDLNSIIQNRKQERYIRKQGALFYLTNITTCFPLALFSYTQALAYRLVTTLFIGKCISHFVATIYFSCFVVCLAGL
jgi:hypothetical protein